MSKINVQNTIDSSKMNGFFWKVYIVCLLVVVFDGYDMNIFGPVMPSMMADLNLTPAQGGLLASYAMYGMLIGSILFGFLADKVGQKKVIIVGIVIYAVFTGLVGSSDTQVQLAICRFIAGLGIAGVVPNVLAYITHYSPAKSRGPLTAWITIGLSIGGILAAVIALLFVQSMGWRIIFYVAYVPIIMAVVVQLAMPETMLTYYRKGQFDKMKQVLAKANTSYTPSDDDEFELHQVKVSKVSFAGLLKKQFVRNTILVCLCYFVNFYLLFGMNTWIPNLMIQQGFPLAGGIWFLLIFYFGALVGTTVGAFAAPRYGYRKILMIYYAITACMLITISQQHEMVPMAIALFICGGTIYGTTTLFNGYVSQCYPATFRSTALGTGLGVGRFGGAAGPVVGGILLGASVPIIINFLAFAIPAAIGVLFIFGTRDYTKIDINSEESVEKL